MSEYAVAVARRSASVIRQLSGQLWIQSFDQSHAHDDIQAPLYGRLRASGFGEVIHGFEHLVGVTECGRTSKALTQRIVKRRHSPRRIDFGSVWKHIVGRVGNVCPTVTMSDSSPDWQDHSVGNDLRRDRGELVRYTRGQHIPSSNFGLVRYQYIDIQIQ